VSAQIRIGDGRLLLPRAICDRHFPGASSAALLERDGEVYLVPLAGPSAGGLLLKQSNAQGDRVLVACDFLDERGLGQFVAERTFEVRWVEDAGALLIEGLGGPPIG
jgi:hypothetical protein